MFLLGKKLSEINMNIINLYFIKNCVTVFGGVHCSRRRMKCRHWLRVKAYPKLKVVYIHMILEITKFLCI